jgi:hypothetical protein
MEILPQLQPLPHRPGEMGASSLQNVFAPLVAFLECARRPCPFRTVLIVEIGSVHEIIIEVVRARFS